MFGYYIQLAWRSLRSSRALSALMVIALGLGIGACMTTLTVYHALSGDPIPHKSARLFDVQIDAGSKVGAKPGDEPNFQLTRFDAEALLMPPASSPHRCARATAQATSLRCSRCLLRMAPAGTNKPTPPKRVWR
jgi:hypothetical protein